MDDIKFALRQKTLRKIILTAFFQGLRSVKIDKKRQLFVFAGSICTFALSVHCITSAYKSMPVLAVFNAILLFPLSLFTIALLIFLCGYVPGSYTMFEDLTRIGMTNEAFEAPFPIRKEKLTNKVNEITFFSKGFPFSVWEEFKEKIETALNVNIVDIKENGSKQEMTLQCVKATHALPAIVRWNKNLVREDDFTIVLGETLFGLAEINLAYIPHWLIGGTTGGGKTQLNRLIIHQCLLKGAAVYLADWKKGVDFYDFKDKISISSDFESLISTLFLLECEMNKRSELFIREGVSNISEHNKIYSEKLNRIIFLVDEVAMILDTKGMPKDIKEKSTDVLYRLNELTRLARYTGIHIILSTQKPTVDAVPGSLKGNLDGRICARTTDSTSSIVILDDGSAAKLPAIKGRFILRDNMGFDKIFQAYLLENINVHISNKGE